MCTNLGADRNGRNESHFVEAVIDGHRDVVDGIELVHEPWQQRQGEQQVGDCSTEGAIGGAGRVDVDPLVVVGGSGELIDPILIDLKPISGAEFVSGRGFEFVESGGDMQGCCVLSCYST